MLANLVDKININTESKIIPDFKKANTKSFFSEKQIDDKNISSKEII